MSMLPGAFAALAATGLSALLFAPFVAGEHRLHGELRVGVAVRRFAVLLYAFGLFSYVFLPFPSDSACFAPQWRPLAALTSRTMLEQFACNVALFVPLGALSRGRLPATVLAGAATSLGIELTQITGIWFIFPCPYRVFDVDDVLANTAGALVGALFTPTIARLLPAGPSALPATEPRPVTAARRLLGMCCDAVLLWLLGVVCGRAADLTLRLAGIAPTAWWEAVALWFAPGAALLAAMLLGHGSSLGQQAVMLRARAPDGRPVPAALRRWAVGIGGLALVEGVVSAAYGKPDAVLGLLWCAVHAWSVTSTRDHRGISGLVAGLTLIDARQSQRAPGAARST